MLQRLGYLLGWLGTAATVTLVATYHLVTDATNTTVSIPFSGVVMIGIALIFDLFGMAKTSVLFILIGIMIEIGIEVSRNRLDVNYHQDVEYLAIWGGSAFLAYLLGRAFRYLFAGGK